MNSLTLGVVARSSKPDERRLPIHPMHFDRIDTDLQSQIFLETGYGLSFGVPDAQLAPYVAGFLPYEELIAQCDVVLLPKPQAADVAAVPEGRVLWGWPHCVQDTEMTQIAIDRRLTLIAFEAMNHWTPGGEMNLHVFHKNNELAGYSSVQHGLSLAGLTGGYGRRLHAVVIGFGATARGAVTALAAQGIHEVTVLTNRGVTAVGSPIHSAQIRQFEHDGGNGSTSSVLTDEGPENLATFLAGFDVIVNCVFQDPIAPLTFLRNDDLHLLAPGTLVIDVSCDEGMGFEWSRPTTFVNPTFEVGNGVLYYAVDHSPSYLWNSATWEVSEALLPYIRGVLEGPEGWDADETLRRAIEIREGRVVNPKILEFQHRSAAFPYAVG